MFLYSFSLTVVALLSALLDTDIPEVYNLTAFLGSSIRQSGRLLTARFQVRVLAEEPANHKVNYKNTPPD